MHEFHDVHHDMPVMEENCPFALNAEPAQSSYKGIDHGDQAILNDLYGSNFDMNMNMNSMDVFDIHSYESNLDSYLNSTDQDHISQMESLIFSPSFYGEPVHEHEHDHNHDHDHEHHDFGSAGLVDECCTLDDIQASEPPQPSYQGISRETS